MNNDKLIQLFSRAHWIMKSQTDGLTHANSMLQLPYWNNNMNWVLGHILHYRDKALLLLGEESVMDDGESVIYARESEPLKDAAVAVELSRLLRIAAQSQERLETALKKVQPERLSEIFNSENGQTIGERIEFIQWHETYHVGQLEILRQLAGTNDSII